MSLPKSLKNPWARGYKLQWSLEQCLLKDFDRVVTSYVQSEDKSYNAFCQLAKIYGVTLSFHWCAPNTARKLCHTREYSDKVIYLILQTAKSFWLSQPITETDGDCMHHQWKSEERFWRQVGGLLLVHILYGNQPSLPDHLVKIDMGIRDVTALDIFLNNLNQRIDTTNFEPLKNLYEGLQFIYTQLKLKGAFQPTILEFELGLNLLNFKN